LLLSEPSLLARNSATGETIAFGSEARDLIGRTSPWVEVISPLRNGVIAQVDAAESMLGFFLRKAYRRPRLRNPLMVIAVPSGTTAVERRAVLSAAYRANASDVFLVEQCLMAAIGLDLPITVPMGNILVDIGGGTTDVAVVSFGGLVYSRTARIGGQHLDRAIVDHIRNHHHVLIGEPTAEKIKLEIGSAAPWGRGVQLGVVGRDLITGLPREVTLTDAEIRDVLAPGIRQIAGVIRDSLERVPPELMADINARGIVLTGGTSQLKNIDCPIREHIGVPVSVAEEASHNVLLGAAKVLRDPKLLAKLAIREELTLKKAA
jgi:rod shape-determining protein MreB